MADNKNNNDANIPFAEDVPAPEPEPEPENPELKTWVHVVETNPDENADVLNAGNGNIPNSEEAEMWGNSPTFAGPTNKNPKAFDKIRDVFGKVFKRNTGNK